MDHGNDDSGVDITRGGTFRYHSEAVQVHESSPLSNRYIIPYNTAMLCNIA